MSSDNNIKMCDRCKSNKAMVEFPSMEDPKKTVALCRECALETAVYLESIFTIAEQYSSNEDMAVVQFQDEAREDYEESEDYKKVLKAAKAKSEKEIVGNLKKNLKTPSWISAELDKYIVGQNDAKKILSVAIYNHYKRIINQRYDIEKSNIMMVGPSGCGKTALARTIANILDVPFVVADATALTEAGYVGEDVESMLQKLIQAADGDITKAEHGIIYIDEIDKIARLGENTSITRDVSGEGVQQALLKLIEGTEAKVPTQGSRHTPFGDTITVNTENILFICGGAFESITMAEKKKANAPLGFGSIEQKPEEKKKLQGKDLVKAGMIPEFIGRIPIIVELKELDVNDLKRVLTEPVNSVIKQYTDLISLDGAKLVISDDVLDFIANTAYANKTGARGLRTVIENSMLDIMYSIPDTEPSQVKLILDNGQISYTMTPKKVKTPARKLA